MYYIYLAFVFGLGDSSLKKGKEKGEKGKEEGERQRDRPRGGEPYTAKLPLRNLH